MSKEIQLTQGKVAVVDDEDFLYLSRFSWRWNREKNGNNTQVEYDRVVRTVNNRTISMEYFILPIDNQIVMFRNGNHFDFRKENLVLVNRRNLVQSSRKYYCKKNSNFSSKYKGVVHRMDYGDKWHARITYDGARIYLGSFDTEDEAGLAYNKKAKELYGDLAYQNKIEN